MKLVADSGSTKTDWCAISSLGGKTYFYTEGYNPFFMDANYIANSIKRDAPKELITSEVESIFFYGSGCQGEKLKVMENALKEVFPQSLEIHVDVDLLGAARALLGNHAGFAAILGTGTNTCLYDGAVITHNIDSLGFLLGDEGSGATIGKSVLSDYLRNKMPENVHQLFAEKYNINPEELLDEVYETQHPNRFCAGFARFLDIEGVSKPYGEELVRKAFDLFFKNLVSAYPDYKQYEFNCIGSIGFNFKNILINVAKTYDMNVGEIKQSIIIDLAAYHYDF